MRVVAILALLTAGTSLTLGAGPALAQEEAMINIRYHDLNLDSAAGRTTLAARIEGAALRVCGRSPAVGLKEIHYVRACRSAATAGAWGQIQSSPQSTASAGTFRGAR